MSATRIGIDEEIYSFLNKRANEFISLESDNFDEEVLNSFQDIEKKDKREYITDELGYEDESEVQDCVEECAIIVNEEFDEQMDVEEAYQEVKEDLDIVEENDLHDRFGDETLEKWRQNKRLLEEYIEIDRKGEEYDELRKKIDDSFQNIDKNLYVAVVEREDSYSILFPEGDGIISKGFDKVLRSAMDSTSYKEFSYDNSGIKEIKTEGFSGTNSPSDMLSKTSDFPGLNPENYELITINQV